METSWGPIDQSALMSLWMRPRFTRCACRYHRSPSSPESRRARILVTAGLYSKVWPTISTRPARSACRVRATASAVDSASGFSTRTCLPAARPASARPACVRAGGVGVHAGDPVGAEPLVQVTGQVRAPVAVSEQRCLHQPVPLDPSCPGAGHSSQCPSLGCACRIGTGATRPIRWWLSGGVLQRSDAMSEAFTLTEDQELFRREWRRLFEDKFTERAAEIDRTAEFPWDNYEILKSAGLLV